MDEGEAPKDTGAGAGAEAVLAGPGSFALAVWISEFGLVQATHVSKPRKQQFKSRRVVISS